MVRPSRFGFNAETAQTNRFQVRSSVPNAEAVQASALREFDGLRSALDSAGVQVFAFDDDPSLYTPDSLFPNNWVSFHAEGQLVYYPMLAANRRQEIRRDWILDIAQKLGVTWPEEIDLTEWGQRERYLEGTGSLVLDRSHRVAYASLSARTHPDALHAFCERLGYTPVCFETQDPGKGTDSTPIYHTNVVMSLGPQYAVLCLEALPDAQQRQDVLERLEQSGKTLIEITTAQMADFAGNQLALQSQGGDPLIVLSERAFGSLEGSQVRALESFARLLPVDLRTIETQGGGSARCMLAEIFAPESPA